MNNLMTLITVLSIIMFLLIYICILGIMVEIWKVLKSEVPNAPPIWNPVARVLHLDRMKKKRDDKAIIHTDDELSDEAYAAKYPESVTI